MAQSILRSSSSPSNGKQDWGLKGEHSGNNLRRREVTQIVLTESLDGCFPLSISNSEEMLRFAQHDIIMRNVMITIFKTLMRANQKCYNHSVHPRDHGGGICSKDNNKE